jgi:peptidoglycan/xylan/chitin deacetylase (PgdA/CDA1 family)
LGKNYALILSFHRVVRDSQEAAQTPTLPFITVAAFENLIRYLQEKFRVITLDDWFAAQRRTSGVILTFDDGWRDNFLHAFPVLKKYRLPAIIFLAVAYIGAQKQFWQVKLYHLLKELPMEKIEGVKDSELRARLAEAKKSDVNPAAFRKLNSYLKTRPFRYLNEMISQLQEIPDIDPGPARLSWDEVKEMQKQGLQFGSHTFSHVILTVEDQQTVARELGESKEILERLLGEPVRHFAYPSGAHNQEIKNLVRQAGCLSAATTKEDANTSTTDPYFLNRIEMEENKLTDSGGKFNQYLFELETCWLYLKLRNRLRPKSPDY